MQRPLRIALLLMAMIFGLMAMTAGPAVGQTRIGPNQHFVGLVNGSHDNPIVYTVCPGPAMPGQMGTVLSGQTLSVAKVKYGQGFTGPLSSIFGWFVPAPVVPVTNGPPEVKFTTYGTPRPIPASVRVPCDGPGQAEFSSCPFLAPCVFGWRPDFVDVTFVNIAV
jgi:hypothetical protein